MPLLLELELPLLELLWPPLEDEEAEACPPAPPVPIVPDELLPELVPWEKTPSAPSVPEHEIAPNRAPAIGNTMIEMVFNFIK